MRESARGPDWSLEQEDGSRGALSLLLLSSGWRTVKICRPMCSACLVQLWQDFQLWSNFSEEASAHELMSPRTNYWVNCINSPWSASSVLCSWAQNRLSRQEDFQRGLSGQGMMEVTQWFYLSQPKKTEKPIVVIRVRIYSLLIKKKKKPFLGQIIDSRLPSNVRERSAPSRGSKLKGYLILSGWFL